MEKIFEEVQRLNALDVATHAERLGKLYEESGELATEINKTNGRKGHSDSDKRIRKNIIEESADVIQNVFSIADGFDITYEELFKALIKKNKKWERKMKKKETGDM